MMKKIMVMVLFICFITPPGALAQWPPYSESFYNPTLSLFNSLYTNSYTSSLFSPLASRGLENFNNYATSEPNNSYNYGNYGNFGNFYQPTFSSFPGSFPGGFYGGLNGGLYSGLTNYNLFSPGLFSPSPFIPNTANANIYMPSLSLGQWNTPSSWPGSIITTANNYWPQVPNTWSMPYPGGQYPYPSPSPYPRTGSGLTIIKTDTEGLLEERIRDALGLGANEPITTAKALTLTSLDASDMCYEQKIIRSAGVFADGAPTHEIRCEPDIDLSILEECTNLTELDLRRNTIDDLSPLAELTNLEKLILLTTNITDITTLAGLTKLTELNLHQTKVSDLSPLAGLTNLEILKLHSCKIEDISPLANLTNLKELLLDNNQIEDISPLAGLVNLKILLLGKNEISDPSPLLFLTNLEKVELQGNKLNDGDCPVIEELRSRGVTVDIWNSDDLDCQ